ncbi:Beta-xylosidase [Drechslerella dactyloides]|uniref:Beta-xylosidase n=1 Tax=Drechslerella dactyloides TaxID=74499 RepID=A0AAD6NPJ4_DREDA|nr:Beta-xylosidase [Drechslerella dactyloides]
MSGPEVGFYQNPILRGFNPDPTICRDPRTNDFFIATSTFEYFPGVSIYQSKDLISWKLIGHALTRRSQLDMRTVEPGGGIWAPTLRYVNGKFYMTTAKWDRYRPAQDLFWDNGGKVYLSTTYRLVDRDPTSTKKDFAIHICEIDLETGTSLTSPTVIRIAPSGLAEGSHIIKRNQYYYLFTAEGGTEEGHTEWVSRTNTGPLGPWELGDRNPLWRNTTADEVQNTGHADLIEDAAGNWWGVFLGVRPWRQENDGKVTWEISQYGKAPDTYLVHDAEAWVDDFSANKLEPGWYHKHTPLKQEYSLTERPGYLRLHGGPYNLTVPESPTMLLQRQTRANIVWTAELDFYPNSRNYEAGTVVWWNSYTFASIGVRFDPLTRRRYLVTKQAVDGQGAFEDQKHALPENKSLVLLHIKALPLEYQLGFSFPSKTNESDRSPKRIKTDITWLSSVSTRIMTLLPPIGNAYAGMMFGVYCFAELERCLVPADFRQSVLTALELGYRHIDTAQLYRNESDVGAAVKESGIPRKDIYIVTKMQSPVENDVEKTLAKMRESVSKIDAGDRDRKGYVDLFLVHTPASGPEGRQTLWKALELLKGEGLTVDIGVSNYGARHLLEMESYASITPVCNQLEVHPFCQQKDIIPLCESKGILITAYAPVARNRRSDDPVLVDIAKTHGKHSTQVMIKWSLQKGYLPLPKSDNRERMKANMDMDGWELTEAEMAEIETLDEGAKGAICPYSLNSP